MILPLQQTSYFLRVQTIGHTKYHEVKMKDMDKIFLMKPQKSTRAAEEPQSLEFF